MIEVLSLGQKNRSHEPSDRLPYLPYFKNFFPSLPKKAAEMEMRVMKIPLSDIDCVTKTIVKVGKDQEGSIHTPTDTCILG